MQLLFSNSELLSTLVFRQPGARTHKEKPSQKERIFEEEENAAKQMFTAAVMADVEGLSVLRVLHRAAQTHTEL